ncbi:MAG: ATP-dependent DNA helicase RecG [bacterium]|nr:ATP-dependent DNA helicase RecG [bacterium]
MFPQDPIEKHFARLRSEQKKALGKLGIRTIRDLLYHFPSRYERSGASTTIASAAPGAEVTFYGTIKKPEAKKSWKSRRPMGQATLEDASGKIKLMWFNQPYIAKSLADGMQAKVTGRVTGNEKAPYIANPTIEPTRGEVAHDSLFTEGEEPDAMTLYPIYPESQGVSSLWFLHALKRIFAAHAHEAIADPIPSDILARYKLPGLTDALIYIHVPRRMADAQAAKKRFAFEEIFALQLALAKRRHEARTKAALPVAVDREALEDFVGSFPFPATGAQTRAIDEIVSDFERAHPMLRLLEGDVGSGKTAVAAATAYLVAKSNLQTAYLCPTEILAEQHFSTFVAYFRDHPIPIGLITGSGCRVFPSRVRYEESAKLTKATFRKRVADGLIPIVIGTHALVEKSLVFKHLAYAIIDEQHRFGTAHRKRIVGKGLVVPHLLSMTATPIPRTLALTIYGDLDLTLLDEMPAGRKAIITRVCGKGERAQAYERVDAELAAGRQAYVICPRIDEPDPQKELALQAKSVKAEAERLSQDVFPGITIGILHSKMRSVDKEAVMTEFAGGHIKILVATSVVEVGVNVENATVILIEGAERFGLAQLHQLRGRVIRSTHQAYCFALPESMGPTTRERMKAFRDAKNGFELAEYDLAQRGAGELGGGRQWGVSDIAMEALRNLRLVEAARREAARLIEADPELREYPALAERSRGALVSLHLE